MLQRKCIDCGFLANREYDTHELVEVERGENGTIIKHHRMKGVQGHTFGVCVYDPPICFVNAFNIQSEYKMERIKAEENDSFQKRCDQKITEVINQPRECEHFTKWQQGFTPKEHREMLDQEWKLEQEKKNKKSDRIWHLIELAITLAVGAAIGLIAAFISKGK